jgi:hypothetical protein
LDGSILELDLIADTGNPFALIVGEAALSQFKWLDEVGVSTNFGPLNAGWLRVVMPELGLDELVLGYGSDVVLRGARASSADFEGLVGVPFLRLVEYGGDANSFWVRPASVP